MRDSRDSATTSSSQTLTEQYIATAAAGFLAREHKQEAERLLLPIMPGAALDYQILGGTKLNTSAVSPINLGSILIFSDHDLRYHAPKIIFRFADSATSNSRRRVISAQHSSQIPQKRQAQCSVSLLLETTIVDLSRLLQVLWRGGKNPFVTSGRFENTPYPYPTPDIILS